MKLVGYSKRELNHLAHALDVAMESECQQRVGAVVVRGGAILAKATNRDRNHPKILEPEKVRAHAGICAERRALAKLTPEAAKGATVFVVRAARRNDSYACSKPCDRCTEVMEAMGVKKCVYIA